MQFKDRFSHVPSIGNPMVIRGLGIVPLISDVNPDSFELVILDEALERREAKIHETSEMGEVPFLKVDNDGLRPVLILEGEELVGGKQNRVVNATIIIPAGSSLKIPVSCMEAGRWDQCQENFDSGGAIFRAKSRAIQKASVTSSIRQRGTFRSDQGAVWDEVSASLAEFGAPSPSSDFRASREKVAERIEEFVAALKAGSCFAGSRERIRNERRGLRSPRPSPPLIRTQRLTNVQYIAGELGRVRPKTRQRPKATYDLHITIAPALNHISQIGELWKTHCCST